LVRGGQLRADRLGARVVRIFDDSIDEYLASIRSQGGV
jgi:hypothetical protein